MMPFDRGPSRATVSLLAGAGMLVMFGGVVAVALSGLVIVQDGFEESNRHLGNRLNESAERQAEFQRQQADLLARFLDVQGDHCGVVNPLIPSPRGPAPRRARSEEKKLASCPEVVCGSYVDKGPSMRFTQGVPTWGVGDASPYEWGRALDEEYPEVADGCQEEHPQKAGENGEEIAEADPMESAENEEREETVGLARWFSGLLRRKPQETYAVLNIELEGMQHDIADINNSLEKSQKESRKRGKEVNQQLKSIRTELAKQREMLDRQQQDMERVEKKLNGRAAQTARSNTNTDSPEDTNPKQILASSCVNQEEISSCIQQALNKVRNEARRQGLPANQKHIPVVLNLKGVKQVDRLNLSGLELVATSDLSGVKLKNCILNRTVFTGVTLSSTEFLDCKVMHTKFKGGDLKKMKFINDVQIVAHLTLEQAKTAKGLELKNIAFRRLQITGSDISGAKINDIDLHGRCLITGTTVNNLVVKGGNWSACTISGRSFAGSCFESVDLSNTDISPSNALENIAIAGTTTLPSSHETYLKKEDKLHSVDKCTLDWRATGKGAARPSEDGPSKAEAPDEETVPPEDGPSEAEAPDEDFVGPLPEAARRQEPQEGTGEGVPMTPQETSRQEDTSVGSTSERETSHGVKTSVDREGSIDRALPAETRSDEQYPEGGTSADEGTLPKGTGSLEEGYLFEQESPLEEEAGSLKAESSPEEGSPLKAPSPPEEGNSPEEETTEDGANPSSEQTPEDEQPRHEMGPLGGPTLDEQTSPDEPTLEVKPESNKSGETRSELGGSTERQNP